MSIGNLKDTGNQGNNLPYQWKVLQGLQAILDEVAQPLTCVDDSILICGYDGTNNQHVSVDSDGHVNTNVNDAYGNAITSTSVGANVGLDTVILTMPATFAEDSAHVSGNTGAFVLGVRNDTNTDMTNANGDYSPIAVNSKGAVAIQDGGNSITVDGGTGLLRTTGILRPIGGPASNVNVVAPGGFYSVSVANVGAANGSILGGVANIKPGEVLNFSADAINNYFNSFAYDASGTEFIIIYVA